MWGWIKKWFDPITVSKIFILSASTLTSTLEEYIDSENIPKKYGGKLDYEYGMLPVLEPAIDNVLQWENPEIQHGQKTIPSGPIKWEKTPDGGLSAVAVGREKGVPRSRAVARLPPRSPEPQQSRLRPAPPSLYRTTTGVSTHPVISDDADLYNDDNPPFDDDMSTDMQSGTSSPYRSEYTVIDPNNRTIGAAPISVPVTSVSPPSPPSQATMSASEESAASVASGAPVLIEPPPSTAPSLAASYASSDLSASSSSIAGSHVSKDRQAYVGETDDASSTTSRSKNKMGSSVYRAALNKATKAMESVGLVGDKSSSSSGRRDSASTASVSSMPVSPPPTSPPPHSQTVPVPVSASSSPSVGAAAADGHAVYPASSGNTTAASMDKVVTQPRTGQEVGAGTGAGVDTGAASSKDEKKAIEEALRNKYASGKN